MLMGLKLYVGIVSMWFSGCSKGTDVDAASTTPPSSDFYSLMCKGCCCHPQGDVMLQHMLMQQQQGSLPAPAVTDALSLSHLGGVRGRRPACCDELRSPSINLHPAHTQSRLARPPPAQSRNPSPRPHDHRLRHPPSYTCWFGSSLIALERRKARGRTHSAV